jgi:hypothetical protein
MTLSKQGPILRDLMLTYVLGEHNSTHTASLDLFSGLWSLCLLSHYNQGLRKGLALQVKLAGHR